MYLRTTINNIRQLDARKIAPQVSRRSVIGGSGAFPHNAHSNVHLPTPINHNRQRDARKNAPLAVTAAARTRSLGAAWSVAAGGVAAVVSLLLRNLTTLKYNVNTNLTAVNTNVNVNLVNNRTVRNVTHRPRTTNGVVAGVVLASTFIRNYTLFTVTTYTFLVKWRCTGESAL